MNPNIEAVFSSIRSLLVIVGTILAGKGLTDTGLYFWIETIAGSIMVVGPAAWGVYSAIVKALAASHAQAIGVQAGINLTVSGAALAADGKTITSLDAGATPPKEVTVATAAEIVKDFGPTTTPTKD